MDINYLFDKHFYINATVLGTGQYNNGLAWKLARGKRIYGNEYTYAVFVIGVYSDGSAVKLEELCKVFYNLEDAQAYIAKLEKYVYQNGTWVK